MPDLKSIEISGAKVKEIFTLARILWCRFHIQTKSGIKTSLRFLETERKLDRFGTITELVLEAPEDEKTLTDLGKISDENILLKFTLLEEEYFFNSKIKDIFILFDQIPAISFEWPETINKTQTRLAERTKSYIPEKTEKNKFYIKDISITGFSFIAFETTISFQENQNIQLYLSIPIIQKTSSNFEIHYIKTSLISATIIRKFQHNSNISAFGCHITTPSIPLFLLIKSYQKTRHKEETFFSQNQYYPKMRLPEIKLTLSTSSNQ